MSVDHSRKAAVRCLLVTSVGHSRQQKGCWRRRTSLLLPLLFSPLLPFIDSLSHYDDVTIEVVLGRINLLVSSALVYHITRVF